MTDQALVELAFTMLEKSYVPYSRFPVGAALEGTDGTVYTGCNVENAAYGSTLCAERTALVKAVSEGCRSFTRLAVVGNSADIAYEAYRAARLHIDLFFLYFLLEGFPIFPVKGAGGPAGSHLCQIHPAPASPPGLRAGLPGLTPSL